jgi:dTDP-4-amino-4,6-dideoxygalactose transaminase
MSRIFLSPPHMTGKEQELVNDAFASNWIAPLGPHVDGFEREMSQKLGVGYACALSSGTGALHLALILLEVGQDDLVFCSDLTFAASANAICYVGAQPVFIDSEKQSWNMDPALLAQALEDANTKNKLPKAVIVVDLYGQCADYDPILEVCARYGVPVIEDAAEALGAFYKGRAAGSLCSLAALSFNGNKIITTSGGGMLLCSKKEQRDMALHLATQAREPAPHYQHEKIGYNYRMSNVLAAIGRGQLAGLDQKVAARRANFAFYKKHLGHLPGVFFMPEPAWSKSNRWLTCLTIDPKTAGVSNEQLRLHLETHNIESRPVWKPMHMQPVFRHCSAIGGSVSEKLFEEGLCLPSGSDLSEDELGFVVEGVLRLFS